MYTKMLKNFEKMLKTKKSIRILPNRFKKVVFNIFGIMVKSVWLEWVKFSHLGEIKLV